MIKSPIQQEQNKKKRQYFRKCGLCNNRQEQTTLIRTNKSPNGWSCKHCYRSIHTSSYVDSNYHECMNYITAHDNDIW